MFAIADRRDAWGELSSRPQRLTTSPGWNAQTIQESEMALFYECMLSCAQRVLDSECCHSPSDWWVRSVHSKEGGRKDSAPKTVCCDADAVDKAEGNIRSTEYREVALGAPESLARGMLPKGFSRNPGELAIAFAREETSRQGKLEANGTDGLSILRPYSTCESGKPQGFRKERPRYPLEGRGEEADGSAEGDIGETQNSNHYVPKTRQTI